MKHAWAILCLVGTLVGADEARLTGEGQIEAAGKEIRVFRGESQTPLFGRVSQEEGRLRFAPSLPLLAGETYRVEIQQADGSSRTHILRFEKPQAAAPTVRLSPFPAVLPANALKLYLTFSHPMEQGVFLERITLQRQDGSVVHGAFRETELWSPDGKRLTLWLHPGRQKTGVNLNRDEGPVLIAGESHVLTIHGAWRSSGGTPIGQDAVFTITAATADHERPDPGRWKITVPKAGTRKPLVIALDEGLDPAMLNSALRLKHGSALVAGGVTVAQNARQWSFVPHQPWQEGTYSLEINPLLEDLAGNNLRHAFEVDQTGAPEPSEKPTQKSFEVTR